MIPTSSELSLKWFIVLVKSTQMTLKKCTKAYLYVWIYHDGDQSHKLPKCKKMERMSLPMCEPTIQGQVAFEKLEIEVCRCFSFDLTGFRLYKNKSKTVVV